MMRYANSRSKLLFSCICLLLTVASSYGQFYESGGLVVIEAENYTSKATNGDTVSWFVESSNASYIGTGYMTTASEGTNGSWSDGCKLTYKIDFTTTGTYYIWLRAWHDGGSSNSCLVGRSGTEIGSFNENGTTGSWVWFKDTDLTFTATSGEQSFQIRRRESEINIDRIVLTDSSSYDPSTVNSGDGPAESSGDSVAPEDIDDLAVTIDSAYGVSLAWTAPGDDGATGTADDYDIRYSTSTITTGNWASATQVSGEPGPSVAGTSESFSIVGLEANETYYFAIRTNDEMGNISDLSNVDSDTTDNPTGYFSESGGLVVMEAENYTGSDANGDAYTWSTASSLSSYVGSGYVETSGSGSATSFGNGSELSYTVDFSTGGTYRVWLRLYLDSGSEDSSFIGLNGEEVDNFNTNDGTGSWIWMEDTNTDFTISAGRHTINLRRRERGVHVDRIVLTTDTGYDPSSYNIGYGPSESGTTDTSAPDAVSDLNVSGTSRGMAYLEWTAPGDDGSTGTATSYDIRYSTSTITEGNWASATQVSGEVSPSVASTEEAELVASGLSAGTTYYFAMKTTDEAGNESSLSNVDNASTEATAPSENFSEANGLVVMEAENYHSQVQKNGYDQIWNTLTGTAGYVGSGYLKAASLVDATSFSDGQDALYTIEFNTTGTYKIFVRFYFNNSDTNAVIAGFDGVESGTISKTTYDTWAWEDDSRTFTVSSPGTYDFHLNIKEPKARIDRIVLTTDTMYDPSSVNSGEGPAETLGDSTAPDAVSDLSVQFDGRSAAVLKWTAPGDDGATGTATSYDLRYSTSSITEGNWASATQFSGELSPSVAGTEDWETITGLSAGTYYYFALKTSDEAGNESALSNVDYENTDADTTPEGSFVELSGLVAFEAENYHSYTDHGTNDTFTQATGTAGYVGDGYLEFDGELDQNGFSNGADVNYDILFTTTGTYYVWLRSYSPGSSSNSIDLGFDGSGVGAGTTTVNNSWEWHQDQTVTVSSGGTLSFELNGDETDLRVDRIVLTDNASYDPSTINSGDGPDESPIDGIEPDDITDLAVVGESRSSVLLNWTAPGDDGATGTATTYDLRYSTSTISEGSWASATQVSGEISPSVAGSTEYEHVVSGLSAGTTYYFAIKASDEVPNENGISNVVSTTTDSSGPSGNFVEQSGLVVFEAENYHSISDNSADNVWDIESSTGSYIGTGYLKADGGSATSGFGSGTDANYNAIFTTTGTYYVWVRMYAGDVNSNEVDTGLDASDIGAINDTTYGSWEWVHDARTVSVGSSGTKTFELNVSDMGTIIDRIVLSDNASYDPSTVNSGDGPAESSTDNTAPDAVADLAVDAINPTSVDLSWTAPGDDGSSGTATTYEFRYSTSTITTGNWASATTVTGEPSPSVAGSSESYTVTGLSEGTTYYFAMKTSDEALNESGLSNVVSATTTNTSPSLTVLKTVSVESDPINSTSNPKNIPGAIVLYVITITNTGDGTVDTDTTVIDVPIPSNTKMFVDDVSGGGSGPIAFVDGGTASGLSYTFTSLSNGSDDVSFSDDNGSTYTYTPTIDGDGCDSSVTNVKVSLKGEFNASGGGDPSFSVRLKAQID